MTATTSSMQMERFDFSTTTTTLPLATQLRPKSLEEFYGHTVLRPQLKKLLTHPRHVIFWGPPGTGKTTLAHLLANQLKLELVIFSAVTSGIPELKKIITEIINHKKELGKQSILFIDEIHRFNKSQQDALLPYLENADFLFMGATTEYPYTSINKALISRVSMIELKPHSEEDLTLILQRGTRELDRPELVSYLPEIARLSNGDARFALNQLARLCAFAPQELNDKSRVLKDIFEHSRQYDRNGNRHHDVISAFIKSIRGSDPQASILYLAIMLDGGEDPEFIARRLMILASEDIGLANNQALTVASNAHYVVSKIGMPEARITLSHATVFLALSPKSNSAYSAINEALNYVKQHPTLEVAPHLSSTSLEKKNYKYPHDYPSHWVEQDYLPQQCKVEFYRPELGGSEKILWEQYLHFTKKKN
jgi:putative ATPase